MPPHTALLTPQVSDRAITVLQPFADLIIAGIKPVENRSWLPPATIPQWRRCPCGNSRYAPDEEAHHLCHFTDDGPYPFRIWVHAAARLADANWERTDLQFGDDPTQPWGVHHHHCRASYIEHNGIRQVDPARLGTLLGTVQVTGSHLANDCARERPGTPHPPWAYCSSWAEPDVYHWALTDPQPLPTPIPMRGRQRLWRITAADLNRPATR